MSMVQHTGHDPLEAEARSGAMVGLPLGRDPCVSHIGSWADTLCPAEPAVPKEDQMPSWVMK